MINAQRVKCGGGVCDSDGYDFTKGENADRWRGMFTPSLKKVMEQVNPRLTAQEDALLFVETLCLRILGMLCAKPLPHSVQDIEEKVKKLFPAPIDRWALNDARETINSKKRKTVLPTDRVHSLLQKDVLQYKIDSTVTVFLVAVMEYISADILKLAGTFVRKIKHSEITKQDIEVAMCADKVLMDMFHQGDIKSNILPNPLPNLPAQRTSTTYEDVVKDLIHDEKQYQRDLHMIIRVFREELVKIVRDPKELDPIFSNILDIYEVTVTLLGSLEDVIEMSQEQSAPCVGSCFEELAEAEEFDVYTKYAQEVTSQQSKDALNALLAKPDAMSLMSAGHGFRDAVKYYMPKLLLVPIWHAFVYFDYIKLLMELSPSQEDNESFEQVQGLLTPLERDLKNIVASLPKESCVPMSSRSRRQLAMERTRELQNTVEHWDKDVGQSCNEFVREDFLGKLGSGKRIAERKVYLFDGLMVLCKANTKRQTQSANTPAYDYRLKEKFFMRHVEINDRGDTDELKNSFEIAPRVQPPVILTAKNQQHKNDWMADLIMINTKSMLDRILDSILTDIEKKHPLRMPSPEIYKFAVPDSPSNIVLEERESSGVPLIKGATLCKLIERLTYHIYADPMFVRTFLTTYRYFCSPQRLLNLLIERFNIPDPSLVYVDQNSQQGAGGDKEAMNCDSDKMHKNSQREDWKRYRKEYVQPVQFRVLNVLRHWVDHHFYDFEKDPTLLENLLEFLENVNGKSMRKWVDSVLKIVQRKSEQETSHKQITFAYNHSPPPIEHHLDIKDDSEINLLTVHPLELARQLTLLEFEMYKNVKPSELVGSPWTKKDKEQKSPNLLKIVKHTTNVTRWIEKSIIEAENYEERVAMVTRAIEVMMVMLELNNFNGILSISAAMLSSSVFRLKLTFQGLPARYEKFLDECREMNDGHLKKYQERLRSINPPCVPFFGRYLTNILHLEEGNPDFLPHTKLINFSKRRKVSEIIGEIQQYQNQPYCLMVDPKIRNFLENLDPFKGMEDKDIADFLYEESLRIEPKGCKQPPKFARKWASISLKSPGIKPRRQNNNTNSSSVSSGVSIIQSFAAVRNSQAAAQPPATNNTQVITESITAITNTMAAAAAAAAASKSGGTSAAIAAAVASSAGSANHACELSPTAGGHGHGGGGGGGSAGTTQGFTVFANVNIPERAAARGSSTWSAATAAAGSATSSNTPSHKSTAAAADEELRHHMQHAWDANGCELPGQPLAPPLIPTGPQLPRKPPQPSHFWMTVEMGSEGAKNTFSPTYDNNSSSGGTPQRPETVSFSPTYGGGGGGGAAGGSWDPTAMDVFGIGPDIDGQQPLTPLPKVVVSPRHEPRSPSHSGAAFNKLNSTSGSHFSPTDSLAGPFAGNTPSPQAAAGQQQQGPLVDFSNQLVPISPHVNVPTAHTVEYRSVPPPLPPRRKERTESCADLAQKRQAPDAPTLPPRDGEMSPPPIPPRLNHHSTCTYPRQQTTSNEFMGGLLLPNTSSIMIRRNSAIEKRAAATSTSSSASNSNASNPVNSSNNFSSSPSNATSSVKVGNSTAAAGGGGVGAASVQSQPPPPLPPPPLPYGCGGGGGGHLHTAYDEQSISPALSSSTTTSPMTPMTPISPHIPSGYQISETNVTASSNNTTVSSTSASAVSSSGGGPMHNPPYGAPASSGGVRYKSPQGFPGQNSAQQQQQQQQYQYQQQHQHHHPHLHHQQQQQQAHTQHSVQGGGGGGGASSGAGMHPARGYPSEYFLNADGTPKLPPKPSLSGHFYNNPDKGTMFLYPSTNQE